MTLYPETSSPLAERIESIEGRGSLIHSNELLPMKQSTSLLRRIVSIGLATILLSNAAHAVVYAVHTKGTTKIQVVEQRHMPESSSSAGGPGHVVAKFSDLIQNAIAYKTAHPTEAVEIRSATYKMALDTYVGFNPSSTSTYLNVSNSDFAGSDSEKLIYSYCKAAQAGVKVQMIIHLASDASIADVKAYLDANGGPNLSYRFVGWGTGSDEQMHNKFMLVNKIRSGTSDLSSVVYTATANFDEWRAYGPVSGNNWHQAGVLVSQNSGLYGAYKKYFDSALWPHAQNTSPTAFRATMQSLHTAPGGLNYPEDSSGISAYFYPYDGSDVWSTTANPMAKIMHTINTDANLTGPYVKMDQAYLRFHNAAWSELGAALMTDIKEMALQHGLNLSSSSTSNVKFVVMDDDDDGNDYSPLASANVHRNKKTHGKTSQFAYTQGGTPHYYSLTGSTNAKYNDFMLKANNMIVVHESGTGNNPVYEDFGDMFSYMFSQ